MREKVFGQKNNYTNIILIAFLTLLVYANSLNNSFIRDDFLVIVNNDFIKSWKNFPVVFTKDYLTSFSELGYLGIQDIGSGETTYRPLVTISYFIDYSVWKLNPFGYHLTNLLLHVFNIILLYFFIGLIAKDKRIALLSSLLFALHPVNAEAVNCIAFREDLLAFLFFISSFIMYIRFVNAIDNRSTSYYYTGSIILFILALFSKEMSVTLPFMLILYDYFFVFKQGQVKTYAVFKFRYAGYVLALLFYVLIFVFYKSNINVFFTEYPYPGGNFYTNVLTMIKVIATYVGWLLLPINIHATLATSEHPLIAHSIFEPKVLYSIALIILFFALAIKIRKGLKKVSFAISWFFLALLPVSNIFPISNIIASRYLYIPAVGFCFLVALLLVRLPNLKTSFISPDILQKIARTTIAVLLIFYPMFTLIRNLASRNDTVLWSELIEHYPNSAVAHSNLANCFRKRELWDKAITEYKTAISLNPNYAKAYNNLGLCYYKKKRFDEAIKEFKKAQKIDPYLLEVYSNLGAALGDKGLYKKAIEYFRRVIKIHPQYVPAYNNLGITYAKMKNWNKAKRVWELALEIKPDYEQAQRNLKKLKQLAIR